MNRSQLAVTGQPCQLLSIPVVDLLPYAFRVRVLDESTTMWLSATNAGLNNRPIRSDIAERAGQ
jgi:hypothetical protein